MPRWRLACRVKGDNNWLVREVAAPRSSGPPFLSRFAYPLPPSPVPLSLSSSPPFSLVPHSPLSLPHSPLPYPPPVPPPPPFMPRSLPPLLSRSSPPLSRSLACPRVPLPRVLPRSLARSIITCCNIISSRTPLKLAAACPPPASACPPPALSSALLLLVGLALIASVRPPPVHTRACGWPLLRPCVACWR